jgi:hypothetical protein
MFSFLRYLLVFTLFFVAASAVAIGWTRFTNREKPQTLIAVESLAMQTPVGPRLASILGVSEGVAEPVDLGQIGQSAVLGVSETAKGRIRSIFINWVARQLEAQRQYLADPAYDEIRQVVCQISESSESAEIPLR